MLFLERNDTLILLHQMADATKKRNTMAENKFKYFTVTTTSIVKASNMAEAEKIASGNRRTVSGVSGELLFKDVDVERITAIKAREQLES